MVVSEPNAAEPPRDPKAPGGSLSGRISGYLANNLSISVVLVLLVLAGLPVAVWLDLRNLSERALREQADDLSSMIDSIRDYYASNVVGRVLAHGERTQVLPDYAEVPGAIPIPAGTREPASRSPFAGARGRRLDLRPPCADGHAHHHGGRLRGLPQYASR
jgi:hypothetical protein